VKTWEEMTDREILLAAADVIHERGWFKGGLVDPNTGAVCTVGALNCVFIGDPLFTAGPIESTWRLRRLRLIRMMEDTLNITPRMSSIVPKEFNLATWNDYTARDADEVVHTFKLTAEACAEDE
jgi:hypothetical protein